MVRLSNSKHTHSLLQLRCSGDSELLPEMSFQLLECHSLITDALSCQSTMGNAVVAQCNFSTMPRMTYIGEQLESTPSVTTPWSNSSICNKENSSSTLSNTTRFSCTSSKLLLLDINMLITRNRYWVISVNNFLKIFSDLYLLFGNFTTYNYKMLYTSP